MRRIRRFLRLPGNEQRLLLKAMLLLGAIRLGLWSLPFQTLQRLLARLARTAVRPPTAEWEHKGSVVWAVETAGRYMPPVATCLTKALTAQVLLLRRGYPALLHIGTVKEDGGRFLAHAWVESGGKVVIGGHELDRYTSLTTLGGV